MVILKKEGFEHCAVLGGRGSQVQAFVQAFIPFEHDLPTFAQGDCLFSLLVNPLLENFLVHQANPSLMNVLFWKFLRQRIGREEMRGVQFLFSVSKHGAIVMLALMKQKLAQSSNG